MKSLEAAGFYLENWLVEPGQLLLRAPDGETTTMAPRPMAVLVCLAESAGQVVSRDTFGEKVWAPAVVSDDALNRCIADLRRTLNDGKPARFIETVPKRGYRLVAEVRPLEEGGNKTTEPSKATTRNNLPPRRSSFVGREQEIARLIEQLEKETLVTLTGVGGAGKTRLALVVAERCLEHFADGVFVVDLSLLGDDTLIAQQIAEAMELPPDNASLSAITHYLRKRQMLLVIDNCEHMIDATADVIDELLRNCPQVMILATSREALDLEGETISRIPSLSLPKAGQPAAQSEAVRLFEERAKAVLADFTVNEDNSNAVMDVCLRLDGMPLAIELAAARVSHLSLEDIRERLDNRFQLLIGSRRRRARRQQTLQATMDWSYDLLTPEEQAFLARLSVFSGTFSLEAIEGVCMEGLPKDSLAVDLLASLVAKSLVTHHENANHGRYRLLETIRHYAAERLKDRKETKHTRNLHCAWYIDLSGKFSLDDLICNTDVGNVLVADIENFRSAMDWAEAAGQWDRAVALTIAMSGVWGWVTTPDEGCRRLQVLISSNHLSPREKACCQAVLAVLALSNGDWNTLIENAFSVETMDESVEHVSLQLLSQATFYTYSRKFHSKAFEVFHAAIASSQHHGQRRIELLIKTLLAQFEVRAGNYEQAIALGESITHYDLIGETFLRTGLSAAYLLSGRVEGVKEQPQQLRAFYHTKSGQAFRYGFWDNLLEGRSHIQYGNLDRASELLIKACEVYFDNPYPLFNADCVNEFAALCIAENNLGRAHFLLNTVRDQMKFYYPFRLTVSHAIFEFYENQLAEAVESRPDFVLDEENHAESIDAALKSELERREAYRVIEK